MPYYDRCVGADVAKVSVMVPAERIPELRPILLDWRRDAKLLLESDLLSADPILQIRRCLPAPSDQVADHRCRNTATVKAWLLALQPRPGGRRVYVPKRRSQP
jgi:hypothetical protein